MDVALPGFILGYHGCDAEVADAVIAGKRQLKASQNDYDWLGEGIYFWEHNAQRAYDFAKQMQLRSHPSGQTIETPAVVGAVIDLRHCLNLLDSTSIRLVSDAYDALCTLFDVLGQPLPQNVGGPDRVARKLDCAVISLLHRDREDRGERPFDTVRAAFFEGKPLYDNAGFAHSSHIQVAVRDPACVLGYFHPLNDKGKRRKFK
jgi:hypothetical protein